MCPISISNRILFQYPTVALCTKYLCELCTFTVPTLPHPSEIFVNDTYVICQMFQLFIFILHLCKLPISQQLCIFVKTHFNIVPNYLPSTLILIANRVFLPPQACSSLQTPENCFHSHALNSPTGHHLSDNSAIFSSPSRQFEVPLH